MVFILATTELHKLPATIISRCQRFDFRRITTEILKDHLLFIASAEGIEITESAAVVLAKHAQGGMRDAISLLDLCAGSRRLIDDALVSETVGLGGRERMLCVVRAIAERDYEAIFEAIDETVRSSRDITVFWQELISVYRDLLIVKNSKEPSRYLDLTDSETEALTSLARLFSAELLTYHTEMLSEALLTMLRANAVRRIVAELTLVRMCDAKLSASTDSMLARIAALENALSSGVQISANATTQASAPEQSPEPKKDRAQGDKPARRAAAKAAQDDDDEIFRGDSPTSQRKPTTERATNVINPTVGAVRELKPFKNRAEAIELMDRRSPMLSAFFKRAKWYTDNGGNMVLRFGTKFDIDNMKMFDGEPFFVKIIAEITGKPFTASQMKCECESEKPNDSTIDRILEAAEE